MPINMFDHYTVRAADFSAAQSCYSQIMGMRTELHTELGFSIALMFLGQQAVVHILETGPALDKFLARDGRAFLQQPERGTGNMEHVAFNGTEINKFRATLEAAGIDFTERTLNDYDVKQIFLNDPDGIEIEVNFPL